MNEKKLLLQKAKIAVDTLVINDVSFTIINKARAYDPTKPTCIACFDVVTRTNYQEEFLKTYRNTVKYSEFNTIFMFSNVTDYD